MKVETVAYAQARRALFLETNKRRCRKCERNTPHITAICTFRHLRDCMRLTAKEVAHD